MIDYNFPKFLYKTTWILFIVLLVLVVYYLINIGNQFVLDNKKIKINFRKVLPVLLGLGFLFLFYNLLKKYTILSDTFYTIIFSVILAYLFNPIINYLEKKNIKRIWGVLLLYLCIFGGILILSFLVIPKSGSEIRRLISDMPKYIDKASNLIDNLYNKYYSTMGDLPPMFQGVQQVVMENIVGLEAMIVNGITTFIGSIIGAFSKIISLVLTPILILYFLADKDYFTRRIMKLIPLKHREDSIKLFKEMDISLSLFVRGKIIMAAYVGIATSIVLLIIGVDFAIVIGFITGIADIIPYIGPFLGFLPAVFFAFLSSPIKAIWVTIFFLSIQWIENNILAPKIIGESTGLHPIIVLLAIVVGGGVFGVFGMILAIPVVSISIIVYKFIREKLEIQNR